MYWREVFATNLAFQEEDLIVIICFLTKTPLFKGS